MQCNYTEAVLHDRVLTTHNMIKRNWPRNHDFILCLCMHETPEHLPMQCNYTEAVWNKIASQFTLPTYEQMSMSGGLTGEVHHGHCK
jgi:hypothetical protein